MTVLDGTVAVVTGASSGIGAAVAHALSDSGADVALLARRSERLEEVAVGLPGRSMRLPVDITDLDATRDAIEHIATERGRIDILVNCAGVMLSGPVADAPSEELERMIRLNLNAVVTTTQLAIPHLVRAADDRLRSVADIVNISSTAGRLARGGNAVYSATKFGVGAFSESLRQELQSSRVRVGVVESGSVATELLEHVRPEIRDSAQKRADAIEQLRSDDVADAVRYMVTRDRRVAINEILVRAAAQTW